jgi:hypothetical protein
MTAPIAAATPTEYTVTLHIEGAPPQLMPYSRVKGRKFQPHQVILDYRQWMAGGPWRITATMYGLICRKDGSVGEQHTEGTFGEDQFPEWLTVLATEHRPAGVA